MDQSNKQNPPASNSPVDQRNGEDFTQPIDYMSKGPDNCNGYFNDFAA